MNGHKKESGVELADINVEGLAWGMRRGSN